ncbi:MAG: 2-phosphosulfolactate phosphatase [Actinomycetota bacterium]|nr:2-phosphosulfolactate phosphatase [Actinomycetota bacterium]
MGAVSTNRASGSQQGKRLPRLLAQQVKFSRYLPVMRVGVGGPHSQDAYDIRFEWGSAGLTTIAAGLRTVVVVDVLSFSTTVEVACSRGVRVHPAPWSDHRAVELAQRLGAELAGGRRSSESAYSLSPVSFLQAPSATTVVLASPNGAEVSLAAASSGATVVAGCLRNAAAVAAAVSDRLPAGVIAAGERRPEGGLRPCWEDLVGAGAIIAGLSESRSPEASSAVSVWDSARSRLGDQLAACASGRELVEAGYGDDMRLAAELDASRCVPHLSDAAFVAGAM